MLPCQHLNGKRQGPNGRVNLFRGGHDCSGHDPEAMQFGACNSAPSSSLHFQHTLSLSRAGMKSCASCTMTSNASRAKLKVSALPLITTQGAAEPSGRAPCQASRQAVPRQYTL